MKKPIYYILWIVSLLCLLQVSASAASPTAGQNPADQPPAAVAGIIDLTAIDWQTASPVKLDGQWEFYPQTLLTPDDFSTAVFPHNLVNVPGPWNSYMPIAENGAGYATYRLTIYAPPVSHPLALKFSAPRTAHKLWVNGRLLSQEGIVSASAATATAHFHDKVISLDSQGGRIELVLQVSNYLHNKGGPRRSLTLGDRETLERQYMLTLAVNLFTFGFMIALGLFYSLFFLIRRSEKTAMYFSLFVLAISPRELTTDTVILLQLFPTLPESFILRLEYMTMFAPVLYAWFVYALLPGKIPGWLIQVVSVAALLQLFVIEFAPIPFFTSILPANQLFFTALLLYLLAVILRACWQKNQEARLLLIGHISLIAAIIHDTIYYSDLIQTGNLYSLGVLVLTGIQAVLVLQRFITAFAAVENLNQKLAALNKLKDDFLAEASHELLTPVHGINGFLESVKESAAARLSSAEHHALTTAMSINRRLVNLVTDIQDFIKLKHHDVTLQPQTINLKASVELIITVCRILAENKQLTFVNDVEPDLTVYADETKLQQILHNLIENAVQYTPAGQISISATTSGSHVTVHVADTGPGIPPAQLTVIFKPYTQVGKETAQHKGSGLGLSISKTLIELHGGTIWVKSRENAGSVFSFTLPVGNRQATSPSPANPSVNFSAVNTLSAAAVSQANILIVDDEAINLTILENHLQQQPYRITKAANGRDALDKLAQANYDLVILDLMMPDLSGYEVCRHIRQRFTPVELPVLILTVRNKPDDIARAFETGANDYLAKPFDKRELLARISALLLMKKSLRQAVNNQRDLLLTQIKPHFFYNVLNTIMGFCLTDPQQAYNLIGEFSQFISHRLHYSTIDRYIALGEELAVIRSYLKIEKARFGKFLDYEIQCNAPLTYPLSPLLIEPLVENAVKHGIRKKKQGGCVSISIENLEQGIKVTVADNGVGMTPERLQELEEGSEGVAGIGLNNVRCRLELDYNQPLHIISSIEAGTTVWFVLPCERSAK